jgi:hypothetical protein
MFSWDEELTKKVKAENQRIKTQNENRILEENGEVEVFRLRNLTWGKCYKWAEYTRRTPETFKDPVRFYAQKDRVVDVGEFVREATGDPQGNGGIVWGRRLLVFKKSNGQETRVEDTSKTCFIEVDCLKKRSRSVASRSKSSSRPYRKTRTSRRRRNTQTRSH